MEEEKQLVRLIVDNTKDEMWEALGLKSMKRFNEIKVEVFTIVKTSTKFSAVLQKITEKYFKDAELVLALMIAGEFRQVFSR